MIVPKVVLGTPGEKPLSRGKPRTPGRLRTIVNRDSTKFRLTPGIWKTYFSIPIIKRLNLVDHIS